VNLLARFFVAASAAPRNHVQQLHNSGDSPVVEGRDEDGRDPNPEATGQSVDAMAPLIA
jgi:hypothetical protein